MDEIIKGLNREKEILVSSLCEMKDYNLTSAQEKSKTLNARLAIIDEKIDEILKSISIPHPKDN